MNNSTNAEDDKENSKELNEKFIRWQGITIEQLKVAVNLILALAIASFGFSVSYLNKENFIPVCCVKLFFTFGLLFLLISILLGIWVTVNRLIDCRKTAQIARKNSKGENVKELREETSFHSDLTWTLFWLQLIFFACGVISEIISFSLFYCNKLF